MSTDSFVIPIQATLNAQTVDELFDEAFELIVLNVRKLAKGKACKAILEGYLDSETKSDSAGLSTASELRFHFRSPGGACDVEAPVCAHWFEVASTLAHEELAKIGERLGYVVIEPKKTARELVDTPREVPFFPHGEVVLAVMRGETPMIASDDDGEVDLDEAELPAAKKKLARALAESGLCACGVCDSVRKGATALPKKEKKAKASKADAPVERTHFTSLPKAMRSPDRVDSLDISKQKLKELPKDIDKLAHLTSLDAGDNWLGEVPPALFLIPALRDFVILSRNPIQTIPETLSRATKLKSLSLSQTALVWLPDCFGDLAELESLRLDETRIRELPPSIVTLGKLKSLSLDKCTSLHEPIPDLGALTTLESLSLAGIGASQVNRIDFVRLTRLKSLNLSGNKLERVPPGIETLTDLCELKLRDNALTDLPESLAALSNVEKIELWANDVTRLPRALTGMPKIDRIELGAPIASLEGIGGCSGVKYVYVTGAQFTSLPDDIGDMASLEHLDLSDSGVGSLPESMTKLRTLASLRLRRTKLTELPPWIGDLPNLKSLDLSITGISQLPDEMRKLVSLESLHINGAPISALPNWVFELPNLKTIHAGSYKPSEQLDKATMAKIKATNRIQAV